MPADFAQVAVAIGAVALSAFLVWFIKEWIAISRRSKALASLPGPQYGLTGILPKLWEKDIHRIITGWANEFGPVFKFRVMQFHAIVITDPALATHVCRSKLLDKFRFQYHFMDEFLGGLNILTGPTNAHWKAVRKGVAPAFSAGCMKAAFGHVVDRCGVVSDILGALGPDRPFNVDDLLLRESMDVIGRVGFQREMGALAELRTKVLAEKEGAVKGGGGRPSTTAVVASAASTPDVVPAAPSSSSTSPPTNSNSNPDDSNNDNDTVGSYVRTMLECTHEIERRLAEPHRAKFLWKKSVREGHAKMTHWKQIVKENLLEHIKTVAPVKGSFADLLLKVRDPRDGGSLSDAQLLPEITALFFAGTDTTGHTGTWALYLLSQHPEAERRALDELRAAGLAPTPQNPTRRPLEYADLGKLVYCQAVVKETLRMYPPVGLGQVRVSDRDLSLASGRLFVPAGTMLWVPHHSLQNAEHNWDEPDKFMPERWLAPGCEYAQSLPMPKEWYEGWYDGGAGGSERENDGGKDASGGDSESSEAPSAAASAPAPESDRGRAKRYFPFAEGPRNCVGQSLAKTNLVATLASLLPGYHFELDASMGGVSGVRGREQYTLVTGIDGGMMMRAIPRKVEGISSSGDEDATKEEAEATETEAAPAATPTPTMATEAATVAAAAA